MMEAWCLLKNEEEGSLLLPLHFSFDYKKCSPLSSQGGALLPAHLYPSQVSYTNKSLLSITLPLTEFFLGQDIKNLSSTKPWDAFCGFSGWENWDPADLGTAKTLYLLLPLPGTCFPLIFAWLMPLFHSGLCLNSMVLLEAFLTFLFKIATLISQLRFSLSP